VHLISIAVKEHTGGGYCFYLWSCKKGRGPWVRKWDAKVKWNNMYCLNIVIQYIKQHFFQSLCWSRKSNRKDKGTSP
jgi:hypothetical protein